MKRSITALLSILIVSALLTGCSKPAAVPAPENTGGEKTEAEKDNAGDNAKEIKEALGIPDGEETVQESDYSEMGFADRFLCGKKNLYYIDDKGELDCMFVSHGDEGIIYGAGSDNYYFVLTGEAANGYTLHFWDSSLIESTSPLPNGNKEFISYACPYRDRFYYQYYDSDVGEFDMYFYDPEGDAITQDPDMKRLNNFFDNYKGRGLMRSSGILVRDLADTGYFVMRDTEQGVFRLFDAAGDEVRSFEVGFDGQVDDVRFMGGHFLTLHETKYKNESYSVERINPYIYDLENGKRYDLEGSESTEGFGFVDIRDGNIYYFRADLGKVGEVLSRTYYRLSIEDLFAGKKEGEKVLTIEHRPGVDDSFGSYTFDNTGYNAMNIRGDTAFYLDMYTGSDKVLKKGDIGWCRKNLESDAPQVFEDAIDDHIDFGAYGTVSLEGDARTTDGIDYYKGTIETFRLYDDVENATAINKILADWDDLAKEAGDGVAEEALNELQDEEQKEWFRTYLVSGYSYDRTFGGLQVINDEYLQISFYDYYYYGGAHGMGGSQYRLFSLKDGKEYTLTDFYKGTEEEFKKIVVKYSMNDYNSENSENGYYDDSPEEMEEKFNQYAELNMNMRFDDYGIYVMYPPYSVGPYASGEIEIYIPGWEIGWGV